MTEEEAKTKWCPWARTLNWDVSAAVNRTVGKYDSQGNETVKISGRHRCIASACMAWRAKETTDFVGKAFTAYRNSGQHIKPGPDDIDGHCGFAGQP